MMFEITFGVVVLFLSAFALCFQNRKKTDEMFNVLDDVLTVAFSDDLDVPESARRIARALAKTTKFQRVSVYIDPKFLPQMTELPVGSLIRILGDGYPDGILLPQNVVLGGDEGALMHGALKSGRIIYNKGARDGAWYVLIPIGDTVCINISDTASVFRANIHFRLRVLSTLLPLLRQLEKRIHAHSVRQSFALERLRSIYGFTSFTRTLSYVGIGVVDYSALLARFGDRFRVFIAEQIQPFFLQLVAKWATIERIEGGELRIVIVPDLLPEGVPIDEAVAHVLAAINDASQTDIPQLCEHADLPVIKLRTACAIGPATIICDAIRVRTVSRAADHVRSLLEFAGPGRVLLKMNSGEDWKSVPGFEPGKQFALQSCGEVIAIRALKRIAYDNRIAGATAGASRFPSAIDTQEVWDVDKGGAYPGRRFGTDD